jgi:hypothetical protein
MSKYVAGREIFQNATMVQMIASQSAMMQIRPNAGP